MSRLVRWPPRPSTWALAAVLGIGVLGGALLVWGVVDSPRVPDAVLPVPAGAEVVGDVQLPDGGAAQSSATNRTISVADADRTAEQLWDAVVDELEEVGWQLEPGRLGPAHLVSTNELEGAHDLDIRLRTGQDGSPPGVRSPPWQPGQPYVTISVVAG